MGAELVTGLLGEVGLPTALADQVELEGDGQPYDTPFPVVECAASVLGSIGAAASLCQTARWSTEAPAVTGEPTGFGDISPYLTSSDTPYGRLHHLGPAARLALTPGRWDVPTCPISTHAPAWQEATARI